MLCSVAIDLVLFSSCNKTIQTTDTPGFKPFTVFGDFVSRSAFGIFRSAFGKLPMP